MTFQTICNLDDFDEAAKEKIFYNLAHLGKALNANRLLTEAQPYQVTSTWPLIAQLTWQEWSGWSSRTSLSSMKLSRQKTSKSKSLDNATILKISKTLPVHHWIQMILTFVNCILGARMAGLDYVLCDDTVVIAIQVFTCAADKPYSEEYSSIEGDHLHRLSHTHAVFKINNGQVFDIIKQGTRGSDIAPTVAPWCQTRNRQAAMKAIVDQHAGV